MWEVYGNLNFENHESIKENKKYPGFTYRESWELIDLYDKVGESFSLKLYSKLKKSRKNFFILP